jgi:hypothetical protein
MRSAGVLATTPITGGAMRLQQIFPWAGPTVPAPKRAADKDEARPAPPHRDGGVSGVQIQAASGVEQQQPRDPEAPDDGVDIVV